MSKETLWQSTAEWLNTGCFEVGVADQGALQISHAVTKVANPDKVVVMVGGIPRDPERQQKLPLINKLYGSLATKLACSNIGSVLYNQPGTGESTGDLTQDSMRDRWEVLSRLAIDYAEEKGTDTVSLVGMSAGSYLAIRAAGLIRAAGVTVESLILQSPAAYPAAVDHLAYGQQFKDEISKGWRIEDTPARACLDEYAENGGRAHVVYFEKDDPPIPMFIQDFYNAWVDQQAAQGGNASRATIQGVGHNFRLLPVGAAGNKVDNGAVRRTSDELVDIIKG